MTTQSKPEASPPGAASAPDWESIERMYRAGMLSVREIARQHHTHEKQIRRKAKELGWKRDLSEKVREAVRTELVRTSVRSSNAGADVRTEREIVEEASDLGVNVFRLHQRNARRGRELVEVLMEQLQGAAAHRDAITADIYEETAYADAVGKDVDASRRTTERTRRKAMLAAVSIPQHAASLRDLATAMDKFHNIELRAHGLSDSGPPDPPASDEGSPSDAALAAFDARLAEITGQSVFSSAEAK